MSTCVKVLTLFALCYRHSNNALEHLLNKIICMLVVCIERYSESLMNECSLSEHNRKISSCFWKYFFFNFKFVIP